MKDLTTKIKNSGCLLASKNIKEICIEAIIVEILNKFLFIQYFFINKNDFIYFNIMKLVSSTYE